MKKTILLLAVVVLVLSLLAACGPNYTKEFDVLKQDVDSLTDEWIGFTTEYGEDASAIQNIEDLNAFYTDKSAEAGAYAEQFEVLGNRLEEIKDGIPEAEYSAYKTAIGAMIDGITSMQDTMDAAVVAE